MTSLLYRGDVSTDCFGTAICAGVSLLTPVTRVRARVRFRLLPNTVGRALPCASLSALAALRRSGTRRRGEVDLKAGEAAGGNADLDCNTSFECLATLVLLCDSAVVKRALCTLLLAP